MSDNWSSSNVCFWSNKYLIIDSSSLQQSLFWYEYLNHDLHEVDVNLYGHYLIGTYLGYTVSLNDIGQSNLKNDVTRKVFYFILRSFDLNAFQ